MTVDTKAPAEVVNFRFVLRAIAKALVLFALFNVAYYLAQPVQNGLLPTVYNRLVPGRVRLLAWDEYSIRRVLADHVIQNASADHFNIIFLGSSEIWGAVSEPDETIPAYLNRLSLIADDGRPVTVYNLGYPGPDVLKDLLIRETVRDMHLPVDAVILTVNPFAFSRSIDHQLLQENTVFVRAIMAKYGLPDSLILGTRRADRTWLWQDRQDLTAWIRYQTGAGRWSFERKDWDIPASVPLTAFGERLELEPVTREGVLDAFAQSSRETGVPLILLMQPVSYEDVAFEDYLLAEAERVQLPLVDCTHVLTEPAMFQDIVHQMTATHPLFAQIVARTLSDRDAASLAKGFPLDFRGAATTCNVYPAAAP